MVLFQKEVALPKVFQAAQNLLFQGNQKRVNTHKKAFLLLFPIPRYCPALSSLVVQA